MRKFKNLHSIQDVNKLINENNLTFLYISRPNCSVCHGLLPQVQALMQNYPKIKLGHINADEVSKVAGHLSVFTVPVLLLFMDGKEYIREARIVHLDRLDDKINTIYKNYYEIV